MGHIIFQVAEIVFAVAGLTLLYTKGLTFFANCIEFSRKD